jgi:hypothetical protein
MHDVLKKYITHSFNFLQVNVTGIQYNFTTLVEKLQYLTTDYNNLTKIPRLPTAQGKGMLYK